MLKLPDDDFITGELVHDPTNRAVDFGTGLNIVIKLESMDTTITELAAQSCAGALAISIGFLFAETIQLGQQQGDIDPNLDPEAAGKLLLDAYLGILYRWSAQEPGQPLPETVSAMVRLILDGIGSKHSSAPRPSRTDWRGALNR